MCLEEFIFYCSLEIIINEFKASLITSKLRETQLLLNLNKITAFRFIFFDYFLGEQQHSFSTSLYGAKTCLHLAFAENFFIQSNLKGTKK